MGKPRKQFTRSTGASSGSESYAIAAGIVLVCFLIAGWRPAVGLILGSFLMQISFLAPMDAKIMYYFTFSQKFGPAVMRNASIGFMECVRPGGKPTKEHCLHL
jgi:hypothetical protein